MYNKLTGKFVRQIQAGFFLALVGAALVREAGNEYGVGGVIAMVVLIGLGSYVYAVGLVDLLRDPGLSRYSSNVMDNRDRGPDDQQELDERFHEVEEEDSAQSGGHQHRSGHYKP